jgi:hypothetical protein
VRAPFRPERNGNENRLCRGPLDQPSDDGGHVASDAREALVFQRMDGGTSAAVQPNGRPDRSELVRPFAAEAARTEVGLRLPAALAPGPPHRAPPQAAHGANEIVRELGAEQPVAHQTFGRQQQALEGDRERARHATRARLLRA